METPRRRYLKRLSAMRTERSSWDEHWRELSEHIQPRRARFFASDTNKGSKRNQSIVNGTPTWAARMLASGMMAGITSPARPWFRLTTPDPDLAEYASVKEWLHFIEERIRQAMARSNVYNALHSSYFDQATFGTGAVLVEEDTEDPLRAYVLPMGQYCLANSARLSVDTVVRELSMTTSQVVEKFTLEKCSAKVRNDFERGSLDGWTEIVHVIEPNRQVQPETMGPAGMAWKSTWFEKTGGDDVGLLREGGYNEFPVLAPRWMVTGEDVYGSSPGMEALGDARALQLLEKRKAQAVEKIINPPMRGPTSLMSQRASLLPGDITYVDAIHPGQVFAPAMEVHSSAVTVIDASIREHEERIKTAFYVDLWLLLARGDNGQMTAREVAERHEEKMLQLGPVVERLQDELLDPLIDRVFGILSRSGWFPPPPPELQGVDLRVEYISVMAQAQKLIGTGSIERLTGFVSNLAAANPEVLDKLDFDQTVDEYATALGVPPALVRSDEQVEALRQARAEQQQQAAMAQQQQQAIQGAKTLSETDTSGDNALTQMLGGMAEAPS